MKIELSKRMQAAYELVTPGHKICDVGTDHGFLPIALVNDGVACSAIAMDLREGPLSRARKHVDEYQLADKIKLRLGSGLAPLAADDKIDTVIIMGMGGHLVTSIIEADIAKLASVKELVLGPQSDLVYVRNFLNENGFMIIKERMVLEDNKYYVFLKAVHGMQEAFTPVEARFGKYLLETKDPVLYEYLQKEEKVKEKVLQTVSFATTAQGKERLQELQKKLQLIDEAKKYWGGK